MYRKGRSAKAKGHREAGGGGGCCGPSPKPPILCCGGETTTVGKIRYDNSLLDGRVDTPAGPVPRIHSRIGFRDVLGRWRVRWGIGRGRYRVAPGLYALGDPDADAPVLVTANYKLTVDCLRRDVAGRDAWILVLDTLGVNVWCAAGEGTFGTAEVIRRVKESRLAERVRHRTLILPQLGAPGVAAHEVRKGCGFSVSYGPVRSRDLPAFLEAGGKSTPAMRTVEFPIIERLVLTPVEITGALRPAAWVSVALFLLAGIGPEIFSPAAAWDRGIPAVAALAVGIVSGAVVTPVLLPWLPGRAFAAKGAVTGAVFAACVLFWARAAFDPSSTIPLLFSVTAVSSFVAMHFTGSTPFTSPSGVEKEMRRAMPVQAVLALIAGVFWIGGAFLR